MLNSYDQIPYARAAYLQSHPDRVATVSALAGMTPAPVTNCRVLELGCGTCFNLIAMAAALPGASFVGVEQSARQVAIGQEAVTALGLKNIELKAMSLQDAEDLGRFDYIIAHGVYSWVPAAVRDQVLTIVSRNLTPQGVAYVSYNCFPGWHVASVVREMLLYHCQLFADPAEQIEQARKYLDYVARGTLELPGEANRPTSDYKRLLMHESADVRAVSDSQLFHDHLEDVNQPVWFHQFADHARAHGLQYVGDADLSDPTPLLAPDVRETLARLSTDPVRGEQQLDFLTNRRFRSSLLCRAGVALDRGAQAERLTSGFRFAREAVPQSARVNVAPGAPETFRSARATLTIEDPVGKATLLALSEAGPRTPTFDELADVVPAHLPAAGGRAPRDELRRAVAARLWNFICLGFATPHVHPPAFAAVAPDRPRASPLARYMAGSSDLVINLRHEVVQIAPVERQLLPLMDGRHDRSALLTALGAAAAGGQGMGPAAEQLEAMLRRLASQALLEP
jgi:SAM-dependent methyltransferase